MVLFQKKRRDTGEESLSPASQSLLRSATFLTVSLSTSPPVAPVLLEVEVRSGLVLGGKYSIIFKPEIQGWAELPLYLTPCSLIKNNGIWVFCGMRGSSFPPSEGPPAQDWALWMVRKTDSLQRPHISLIPMETSPLRRCRLNLSSWCVFMEQPGPLLLPSSPPPPPDLSTGKAGRFSAAARAGGCDFNWNLGGYS